MYKVRCLIVDDEPLGIEVIKAHVARIPQLEVVAECSNAIEALDALRHHTIDLIFLDIQMPMLTGIEFLRSLTHPPKVIFTTAYRDYALESYELDVVDYLLKPISFERFFKAINKYLSKQVVAAPTPVETPSPEPVDFMDFNSNKKTYRIKLSEIIFIESLKDYIKIHVAGKEVSTKIKISEIAQDLPPYFLRIHRSFIVNTREITAFNTFEMELGKVKLPIGSSYKQEVQLVLRGGE